MGRFVEGEWLTEKEWATKDGEFVRKPTAFRDRITPDGPYTPDAGRYLLGWVQEAGFVDIETTVDVWTFADPDSRAWWGDLWADRVENSSYTIHAGDLGLASDADLADIAAGWRRWIDEPAGFFACPNVQILARAT